MMNEDDLEEKFFSRKERKQERKIASRKDRSKYKKSDLIKTTKIQEALTLRLTSGLKLAQGRVLSILPEGISVDCDGSIIVCNLKGVLKKETSHAKNLVVVGDFVQFDGSAAIVKIEKRHSLLCRQLSRNQKKLQILASNIDQVLITVSALSPPLKPHLIDRFVIAARKGNMEPVIVINKIDLLKKNSPEKIIFDQVVSLYSSLGFTVIALSGHTQKGIEKIKAQVQGKASVFAGESGVGKSSLINALTGLQLLTNEVGKKSQRGVHTTVGAQLIPLICGGWCIDTPGIQNFGLWDLQKSDLDAYFEEIFSSGRECKYPDCNHTKEPHCAVKNAVTKGTIAKMRYDSYCSLLEEL